MAVAASDVDRDVDTDVVMRLADAGLPREVEDLVLAALAGDRALESAAVAWAELSRRAHHHAYGLAPTVGELRRLHGVVRDVIAAPAPGHPGKSSGETS